MAMSDDELRAILQDPAHKHKSNRQIAKEFHVAADRRVRPMRAKLAAEGHDIGPSRQKDSKKQGH
jgi:hypothetical protein